MLERYPSKTFDTIKLDVVDSKKCSEKCVLANSRQGRPKFPNYIYQ